MSTISILDYPVLTEDSELFSKLGFCSNTPEFYYKDKNERFDLIPRSSEGATTRLSKIELEDEQGIWDQNQFPFYIHLGGILQSPKFLFGPNGLVPENDSSIGLALIWTDRDSKVRGCEPIGEISSDSANQPFQYSKTLEFEPGLLRGTLTLRLELYLYRNGDAEKGEVTYFASERGTLLGTLDEVKVILEGNGSIFPISDAFDPGKPLWWIKTNIDDITQDHFDEDHFVLLLNKAHPAYDQLMSQDDMGGSSYLFDEVLASALFTLIIQIVEMSEEDKILLRGEEACENGSVCHVLRRMLKIYGWLQYLDEPAELSKAIHQTVETLWK